MTPGSSTSSPGDGSSPRVAGPYRIFLSSPSDVEPERDAVARIVDRINAEFGPNGQLKLFRWEDDFYTASRTFQSQMPRPSECDVVICIFWKRLGTELPDQFRRSDGTLPTGSEYEFEDAVEHAAGSPEKLPDVLVYRKEAEVLFTAERLELEKAQWDRFLLFWRRWFRNEKGQFVAGFHSFDTPLIFEAMIEAHLRKWLQDRAGQVTWTQGSPFRGLRPFDVEHAPIFFGRRRETERARARFLANAVSGTRFLLIVGPSGSGKSSLVRAGLIPRLMPAGGVSGLPHLNRRAIVSPAALTAGERADWALGLSRAFFADTALGAELAHGDFNTPELLAVLFTRGGPEAATPVRRALERAAVDAPEQGAVGLILMVDQFEEIFAWPSAAAEAFVSCLAALSSSAPVYLIATMRSEFQHRLDEIEPLAKLAAVREVRGPDELERILDIGLPSAADIRDMIDGPAQAAGLTYAGPAGALPALDDRIEGDSTPEALPALEYLLTELYERRDGNVLTHAAYDALGGVTGVLTSRGETVLSEFGDGADVAFRNIVRSLISTGTPDAPTVARRVSTSLFPPDSAEGRLVAALRDAGLLVSDRDTLRLAHESLITNWPRLNAIVAKERQLFDVRERLLADYRHYSEVPATERATRQKLLLRGLALEEARDLLAQWGPVLLSDPFPALPDYIAASDRAERGRRIRLVAAASAVSAVFAGIVIAAVWFRTDSIQSSRNAEVRLQLARAEAALRVHDWDRALDIATGAFGLADTPDTRSMALTALMEHSSPNLAARLSGPADAARFAADGTLVTLSRQGVLAFMAAGAHHEIRLADAGSPGLAYFDFTPLPDGGLVVLMSDGRAGVVEAQYLRPGSTSAEPVWLATGGYVLSYASQEDMLAIDGRLRIAVTDGSPKAGRLLTCNLASIRDCQSTDLPSELRAVALSSDGRQLAVAADASVSILDLDNPASASTRSFEDLGSDSIQSVGWLASSLLGLGTRQGELIALALRTDTLDVVSRTKLSTRPIAIQKGAPSLRQVLSSCDDELCLLTFDDAGSLRRQARLYHIPDATARLAWSADGQHFASVHADHQVRVWNALPPQPLLQDFASAGAPLISLAVDRKSGRFAAGDTEGRVWIWSKDGGANPPRRVDGPRDEVVHLAFSPNGTLAAAYRNGELARIPPEPDKDVGRIPTNRIIQRVAWLADGTTLAAATPERILLVDAKGALSDHDIGVLKRNQTIGGLLSTPARPFLIMSISDGTLLRWEPGGNNSAQPLVPSKESADTLSALSLALDPTGRWLVGTRADEQVRVYDVTGSVPTQTLPLPTRDSKTVAFSPDGTLLSILTSDDAIHVWRFNASTGTAKPLISVAGVPTAWRTTADRSNPRQALWIDWVDSSHLAIATYAGSILILSVDPQDWTNRMNTLRNN